MALCCSAQFLGFSLAAVAALFPGLGWGVSLVTSDLNDKCILFGAGPDSLGISAWSARASQGQGQHYISVHVNVLMYYL